jgi:hypothetical protein
MFLLTSLSCIAMELSGENNSILVSCPRSFENMVIDECLNKTMECDIPESLDNLYCLNATLISRQASMCNSTTVLNGTNVNETTTILNCYPGSISEKLASFVPTTTTAAPIMTTTEKQYSFGAKVHMFFLKIMGKSDILENKETTTPMPPVYDDPRLGLSENETAWIPEALTIPPEPTTLEPTTQSSTTEGEFDFYMANSRTLDNGTVYNDYTLIPSIMTEMYKNRDTPLPEFVVKLPRTSTPKSEEAAESSTVESLTTTTSTASPTENSF